MASLIGKLAQFARSPKGRELTERAKQIARDPKTRRKVESLRARAARKR